MGRYENSTRQRGVRGFTIVELLIVIVVIAILAVITVTTYNGITRKAEDASLLAVLDTYEKAVRLYYSTYGTFPSTEHRGLWSWVCLGEVYPEENGFMQGECGIQGVSPSATVDESINIALREFVQPLPDTHHIKVGTLVRGFTYQGVSNHPVHGSTAAIGYYIEGDRPCGRGKKMLASGSPEVPQFTMCTLTIVVKN
ncbi:type II secretion system protein [Candidatus Saccharibacteria bacterium TM7i]|nr:type II secretion system protein [Candidatus Saccharibacteria bacterium TM7i]